MSILRKSLMFLVSIILFSCESHTSSLNKIISEESNLEMETVVVVAVEDAENHSLEMFGASGQEPIVPFGKLNADWISLKDKIKKGDELVYFKSSKISWDGLYGREGYALIREGKVIAFLIVRLS